MYGEAMIDALLALGNDWGLALDGGKQGTLPEYCNVTALVRGEGSSEGWRKLSFCLTTGDGRDWRLRRRSGKERE